MALAGELHYLRYIPALVHRGRHHARLRDGDNDILRPL